MSAVCAIACVLCAVAVSPAGSAAPERPNVLLILADDLGAECLGSYGSTSYKTPHLDALARTGVRFEHCFATPLCSPSRVQLMTGRYPFRTGWTNLIRHQRDEFLDPKERTFGHMLRDAGYATALAGKWQLAEFQQHPDHVRKCGFDESCCWAWVMDDRQTSRYWSPAIWQEGKLRTDVGDHYGPDVFCDFLIDFISRNRERPFLAYYPMALVHAPFARPPGSDRPADTRPRGDAANFPDMVAYMDRNVGRLVETLDRLGLREKTLILFSGDNGTARGIVSRVGEREIPGGKGQMTDAGTHVPLIANWKGAVPPGRVCTDLVDFSDVMPTLAEVTGAKLPEGVAIDGRSFAPQLRGETGRPRDWVFSQLGMNRFVRDHRWKLHADGRLFDIQKDPTEAAPVAPGSPEPDAARARLAAVLDTLK